MEDFINWIYGWKSFYGIELYDHLKGWDETIMNYNADYYQFDSILKTVAGISLIMFILYYYILNNPRLNRWWHWLMFLCVVALSSYMWGYYIVDMDIQNGAISSDLINQIGPKNAIFFGLYNAIVASIIFCILSVLCRHLSKNCKHSPYTSVFNKMKKQ